MSVVRAEIPITIVEGGTFNLTFTWETGTPFTPVDLTGFDARMQVRAKLKDLLPILDLKAEATPWEPDLPLGIYLYDSDAVPDDKGKYRIYISDEDTKGICAAHKQIDGVYDLFLYNTEGEAVFQQYGSATLIPSVTRDE